jgi:hypothetical protein
MRWLFPPEWLADDVHEFAATVSGPWRRAVQGANAKGIGTARHVQLVPRDDDGEWEFKGRTLTKLYNDPPTWLTDAHRALDAAVLRATAGRPI